MVLAWFLDRQTEDGKKVMVPIKDLGQKTGVVVYKVNPEDYRSQVDLICQLRHYRREDTIEVMPEKLENYEEMMKKFNTEHFHNDEEVRCVLRGRGYFDVRDQEDQWIRIQVDAGDFLILPGGIYHRFHFDNEKEGIYFLRLFVDEAPYHINFRGEESPKPEDRQQPNFSQPMQQSAY